jgi:hypothetical protein
MLVWCFWEETPVRTKFRQDSDRNFHFSPQPQSRIATRGPKSSFELYPVLLHHSIISLHGSSKGCYNLAHKARNPAIQPHLFQENVELSAFLFDKKQGERKKNESSLTVPSILKIPFPPFSIQSLPIL